MDRAAERQRMIHHMQEIARHLHSIQGDITAILDADLEIKLLPEPVRSAYLVISEDAESVKERVLTDISVLRTC